MRGIYSFSRWLPEYYNIPCAIHIHCDTSDGVDTEAADYILSSCLQLAAAKATENRSSLQLCTYSSDVFIGRYVLVSLPQDTLTSLQFSNISSSHMADLSIGLQHLGNLRSLQLEGLKSGRDAVYDVAFSVDVCMPAIGQLTSLTNLVLVGVASFSYEQLPAKQLQRLEVSHHPHPTKLVAAFSHLTRLSYLCLEIAEDDAELGPLPVQLVELVLSLGYEVSTTDTSLNLSALKQLSRVSFDHSYETKDCLMALRTLPNLQHVHIHISDIDSSTEASAAWPRLPQLHSVHVSSDDSVFVASLEQLMQNISGTTSLTQLLLNDININGPGLFPPFCRGLASLSGLQELALEFTTADGVVFVANDVQKLSTLTQLTELHLKPVECFVMDDDVVVLALRLQRLQILYVPVRSVPVLAAICHGGSKDLQVLGTYTSSTLEQDATWLRYVDESHFSVKVVKC